MSRVLKSKLPSFKPSFRIRRGVHETARMTGISPSHVSKILKGTRRPSADVLEKLAAAWGTDVDAILKELNKRRKSPSSTRAA